MREMKFNKKQVVKYLAWTFGLAYVIQIIAARIYNSGNAQAGQLIIAAMMFVPAIGLLLAGGSLKGLGWKIGLRKNAKPILIAWFSPALLTAAGAVLYFLVFPGHFDLTGQFLTVSGGSEVLAQLEAQGISYRMYILITGIACITYAPLINTVVGLGEEIGWRGFLYPQLKTKFGCVKGRILGGVIWGAWHWPLIWLIGYEYGAAAGNPAGYVGFPIVGMLVFCIFTIACGVLCDWLCEKSGSIWLPSLFHGSINAAATMPIALCIANTGSLRLLGPMPNGLIAGLPMLILGIILLGREK